MKYEDWCKKGKEILADADAYNDWADKAKVKLLCKYGPRIAVLGNTFYMGCGFHYSLEQRFGRLIDALAISWKPCANWCANIEDDWAKSVLNKVIYEEIVRTIIRAERSAKKIKKEGL